jgi:hypothetical protein
VATGVESRPSVDGYSSEEQPLRAYASLTLAFGSGMGAALLTAARRGRLPDRVPVADVAAMALATHKLSRLITKDAVTSWLRAPFVRLEEKSGTNSLEEQPRGDGLQLSIGELLSCPECTGQWVAGGLLAGLLHAPRATRAVTSLYSALAIADLLQFVYTGIKNRT